MARRRFPTRLIVITVGIFILAYILSSTGKVQSLITEDYNFGTAFNLFENAPPLAIYKSVFSTCTTREFINAFDPSGNRLNINSFDFHTISPLLITDITQTSTGIKIDKFVVNVYLKCQAKIGDTNIDVFLFGGNINAKLFADNSQGKTIQIFERNIPVQIDKQRFKEAKVLVSDFTTSDQGYLLATYEIKSSDIETKLADKAQFYTSYVRIKSIASLNVKHSTDTISNTWTVTGVLDHGVRTTITNPKTGIDKIKAGSPLIEIGVTYPSNGMLDKNKQIIVEAKLPKWVTGEGLPTIKVSNVNTPSIPILSTLMKIGTVTTDSTTFTARHLLPITTEGQYQIAVSLQGRNTATAYVTYAKQTTDPCLVTPTLEQCKKGGEENGNGGTDEEPTSCDTGILWNNICLPELAFWLLDGWTWLWILGGIFILIIGISIAKSGGRSGGGRGTITISTG